MPAKSLVAAMALLLASRSLPVCRQRTEFGFLPHVHPPGAAAMVTKDSWDRSILGCEYPVLVEFYASWWGPCSMVQEVIDEIAREYEGKIKCYLLNTDQDLQIARSYDVKAGEKRESLMGTMPKIFYEAAISRAMDS